MVSVHWDMKCIDNETFYNNLNTMAYTINNFLQANNNNDKEHLQKQLSVMQKLQEAYKDNPHRKYQYFVEEKFIKEMILDKEQKDNTTTEIIK
jgi:flagellin-specific chaperone FliS